MIKVINLKIMMMIYLQMCWICSPYKDALRYRLYIYVLYYTKVQHYSFLVNIWYTSTQEQRHLWEGWAKGTPHFLKYLKPEGPPLILASVIPFRVLHLQPPINT